MAGPSGPFSGSSQLDGAANSAGRGRGSQGRATSHLFKTPTASRGANTRGRGRGTPSAPRSGRGRGFASNTWRRKPESNTSHEASGTPFAQLKQSKPFSPSPGGQRASQNPPFPRGASGSRGQASLEGTAVDSSRGTRRQASGKPVNGTAAGVGMGNTPVLSQYSERYEQVSDNVETHTRRNNPDQYYSSKSVERKRGRTLSDKA